MNKNDFNLVCIAKNHLFERRLSKKTDVVQVEVQLGMLNKIMCKAELK